MPKIVDLTGPGLTTEFGVDGTDLGIPVATGWHGEELAWVFGDSFSNTFGEGWRSPVLLRSARYAPEMFFAAAGPDDYAKKLVPDSNLHGVTWLPSDVINLGGVLYLWLMRNKPLGTVTDTRIFVSHDDGENWVRTAATWPGNYLGGIMQQVTWERGDDGHVYLMHTGFQRNKPLYMSRVPEQSITDRSSYEHWAWNGSTWGWSRTSASFIRDGRFGELNLRRIENKWVLTHFDEANYRIAALVTSSPYANYVSATPRLLIRGGMWGAEDHARDLVAQPYGGYAVPGSTLSDFRYVVSQWRTDDNSVYKSMLFRGSLV